MPLPPNAYVILGMLRLGARSGYDVKRGVELSTRFFWTISQAQIYPLLRRLEEAGLITGHDEPRGRRRRRAYELTPAGESTLRAWLTDQEALAFEVRDIAMLKLFFADALDAEEALKLARRLGARSTETLARLQAQSEPAALLSQTRGDRFPSLVLQVGIAVHEALVEASRTLERELTGQLG